MRTTANAWPSTACTSTTRAAIAWCSHAAARAVPTLPVLSTSCMSVFPISPSMSLNCPPRTITFWPCSTHSGTSMPPRNAAAPIFFHTGTLRLAARSSGVSVSSSGATPMSLSTRYPTFLRTWDRGREGGVEQCTAMHGQAQVSGRSRSQSTTKPRHAAHKLSPHLLRFFLPQVLLTHLKALLLS